MFLRMLAAFLTSLVLAAYAFPVPQTTYEDTLRLLRSLKSRHEDREILATLFQKGDARIGDLIKALHDPDRNISLNAQIVIRYLGNQSGMRALEEWNATQAEIIRSGPTPLPLSEREYKWFSSQPLRYVESSDIYALALDGSPKAQAVLNKMLERYDESVDAGTSASEALKRVKAGHPKALSGADDLAELVLKNAFFVDARSRRYTSTRLLGLNGAKDKALVEVYVNRRAFAEEWYHVVISKCGPSWKFFSITLIAAS